MSEDLINDSELRGKDLAMGTHELADPLSVTQVLRMTQLIDLVRANRADCCVSQVPVEVGLRRGQEGNAVTSEGDLGR